MGVDSLSWWFGVDGAVEVSLALRWLAHLLCILGMVFANGCEHMCAHVCFLGLFPGWVGGGWAGHLGSGGFCGFVCLGPRGDFYWYVMGGQTQ